MKARTKTRKPPRRLSGANPYARPRRSARAARSMALPVIEEHIGAPVPALVFETGAEVSWDNIACWRLGYRCRYRDGHIGRRLHVRNVIAATRAKALETLQRMQLGFGVATLLLYEVRGPLTLEQIAELKQLNEEKPWKEPRSNAAGAAGDETTDAVPSVAEG